MRRRVLRNRQPPDPSPASTPSPRRPTPSPRRSRAHRINEALDWLDENPEADKDEYTSKQKEVEAIANPIMRNVYQGAGGPGGGEEEEDYDFGDDEL